MQQRPCGQGGHRGGAAAEYRIAMIDVGSQWSAKSDAVGRNRPHRHGPRERDMVVQVGFELRFTHAQAFRSSSAREVIARRLAMVLSLPRQRPAPSGLTISTSGKRPKL